MKLNTPQNYMIFIMLMTIMAYSSIFTIPFLYSETFLISQDIIQDISLFFDKLIQQQWKILLSKPLSTFSFALNYAISEKNPAGYHAVNLVIHLINVGLVYALAHRFFKFPVIAASLFALHPIGTSCVSQIFGRSYSLGTCFMLAGLWVYFSAQKTLKTTIVLTGLFFLMLLSKQTFVFFPFILLWHHMQIIETFKIKYVPVLLMIVGIVLFYALLYAAPYSQTAAVTPSTFALSQLGNLYKLVTFYFAPFQTALRHDLPFYTSLFSPYVLLGIFYLLAFVGIAVYFRKSPIGFLMGALLLALLPTNSVFPKDEVILEWRLYPSLVFFCLLMGELFHHAQKTLHPIRGLIYFIYAIYLGSFIWTIRETNQHYQSNIHAWEHVVKKYPYSANAVNNIGVLYASQDNYPKARDYFHQASAMNPRSSTYKINLAKTQKLLGQAALSETLFEEGLQLRADYGSQVISIYFRN